MVAHKFAVGDRVRFIGSRFDGDVPAGVYTIVRRLPVEGNVCQYRVRHLEDGHERVMRENQIEASGED
jgi:hypothetical protein